MKINFRYQETNATYYENFWTGRKEIFVDGVPLIKISKKEFIFDSDNHTMATVKGNYALGVKITFTDGTIIPIAINKWYDNILVFISFAYIIFSVIFCPGVLTGGLSGFMAACVMIANAYILRTKMNHAVKILLCLLVIAAGFAILCTILAAIIGGFPLLFA